MFPNPGNIFNTPAMLHMLKTSFDCAMKLLKSNSAFAIFSRIRTLPGHAVDGNGGAAPGVAVELGLDTAAEATTTAAVTLVSNAAATLTATQSAANGRPDGNDGSAAIAMQ